MKKSLVKITQILHSTTKGIVFGLGADGLLYVWNFVSEKWDIANRQTLNPIS